MINLLNNVIYKEYLLAIAEKIKKKRFKTGFDGMTIEGALSWIYINGDRLCKDILNKDYSPMPAVGFRIAKHQGGFRSVSRISAIDTIVQNAICDLIIPLTEDKFSDSSFAYRPKRGVNTAIERYILLANKYPYATKFDICSCFNNINHNKLKESLKEFFDDEVLCDLCMKFIKTPLFIDGEILKSEKGILQGMPLAPVLCNIYLHNLDCFLSELNIPFVRYADDIIIFWESLEEMSEKADKITDFLSKRLFLKCNAHKSKTDSPAKLVYLGYRFASDKKGIIAKRNINNDYPNYTWHSQTPHNNHRTVDLVSDGILRQSGFSMLFDTETIDTDIPVASTDIINVFSDVIIDSGSVEKLMKNNITINFINKYGECIGTLSPNNSFKDPRLTHIQIMEYYNESSRLELAKEFVLASIHNDIIVIRYYNKHANDDTFTDILKQLTSLKKSVNKSSSYEELLTIEARARKIYYSAFDMIIKRSEFSFEVRTRRPPRNMVNAMISFGNTLLYNYIASEIQKTALDVRVGYLHATSRRKKTLNLDIAEIFKPILVDRLVFSLINKNVITPAHFVFSENGAVFLTAEGKRIFLKYFYLKLNDCIKVNSIGMTYRKIITEEVYKLIRKFRHNEKYKAYRQVR